jgi:hypothetical protein
MAEAVALNIYQRINEVRKLCPYIKKDKKVDGGGYMAVTHDAVTAELRDHLIAQGIVIVPRLIAAEVVATGTMTKNQIPIIRYEARYEIDFVNIDSPDDRVTVPLGSHANDQGDKAPGKATSYATKYAMLKLFSIETGEEDEGRHDAQVEVIAQEQQFELHAYCEENGLNGDETLKAMAIKAFGLKAITELPKDKFEEAKELLKRKVASATANPGVVPGEGDTDNSKQVRGRSGKA